MFFLYSTRMRKSSGVIVSRIVDCTCCNKNKWWQFCFPIFYDMTIVLSLSHSCLFLFFQMKVETLIRPLKINCAFWVTSLVPLAFSGRKTRALYFMFPVGQQIFVCRKFSRTSAKYLRKQCVFFHRARFFASLARSFSKNSWLKTHNLF